MVVMVYTEQQKENMISKVSKFAENYMSKHTNRPYHNIQHAKEVAGDVLFLARLEGLGDHQKFLLKTAALTHDLINNYGSKKKFAKSDEDRTAELVEKKLPKWGYTSQDVKVVSDLIRATKIDRIPKGVLEEIMRDADVSNLGKDIFMHKEYLIRQELGKEENKEWYVSQKEFLDSHTFFTTSASENWNAQKKKNKKIILSKIKEYQ